MPCTGRGPRAGHHVFPGILLITASACAGPAPEALGPHPASDARGQARFTQGQAAGVSQPPESFPFRAWIGPRARDCSAASGEVVYEGLNGLFPAQVPDPGKVWNTGCSWRSWVYPTRHKTTTGRSPPSPSRHRYLRQVAPRLRWSYLLLVGARAGRERPAELGRVGLRVLPSGSPRPACCASGMDLAGRRHGVRPCRRPAMPSPAPACRHSRRNLSCSHARRPARAGSAYRRPR